MIHRQTHKVVRRPSEPIEAEAHRVLPPQPAGGPKHALYAYVLIALWQRAKMLGDLPTARALLAELERLAERPKPRRGGERDRFDSVHE
jgi:hypothetical protein